MYQNIFTPNRDVQQDRPVARCEGCRGEVFREEATFLWDGKELCSDCFKALVESLLHKDMTGLAAMMQVDVERYV